MSSKIRTSVYIDSELYTEFKKKSDKTLSVVVEEGMRACIEFNKMFNTRRD